MMRRLIPSTPIISGTEGDLLSWIIAAVYALFITILNLINRQFVYFTPAQCAIVPLFFGILVSFRILHRILFLFLLPILMLV